MGLVILGKTIVLVWFFTFDYFGLLFFLFFYIFLGMDGLWIL